MYVYSIRQVLAFSHWIIYYRKTFYNAGFPDGLVVKNLPANAGDVGLTLGSKNPLEEGMATHSSILACRIPWTEEPGGL